MIKLITFNIKCGGTGEYAIDHRAPLLKTVLDRYDADLIGFQEATPNWMEHLEKDLGEEYELFNKYRAGFSLESTPIAWRKSRFDCLDKGYFWLSDTPDVESGGWDNYGCYRICMWVKLLDKKEGKTLTFFNTHYGFGDDNQLKSGKLLLDHFKALNVDCGFVTADFNMYPSSPGYKYLTAQLVDANAATVNDMRTTFHGYAPEKRAHLQPIDFCFVTPETVVPLTAKRIDDLVNGEFPSDHFGFYFELEVRSPLHVMTQNTDGATSICTKLERENLAIATIQELAPKGIERIGKNEKFDYVAEEGKELSNPVVWMTENYELVEKDVADGIVLAVLKNKLDSKKICVVNGNLSEDEAEQLEAVKAIIEKTAAYAELPVMVAGTLNIRIGSEAYRLLCENFTDLRRSVAPLNYTPTYNGRGEEMADPCICDYIFVKNMKPLRYEISPSKGRSGYSSDHNGIIGTIVME